MKNPTPEELKLLRDKAAVLDYIASQSSGMMVPLIFSWYPTPPEANSMPDVKPFTAKTICTCFDVMGVLDGGEHFPKCPALKLEGNVLAPGFEGYVDD